MTVVESLPDRPLLQSTVDALDASDSIEQCVAIAGLRSDDEEVPPTDVIVSIYLDLPSTNRLLVFDSVAGEWLTLDMGGDGDDWCVDTAVDHSFDWLGRRYDATNLAIL